MTRSHALKDYTDDRELMRLDAKFWKIQEKEIDIIMIPG